MGSTGEQRGPRRAFRSSGVQKVLPALGMVADGVDTGHRGPTAIPANGNGGPSRDSGRGQAAASARCGVSLVTGTRLQAESDGSSQGRGPLWVQSSGDRHSTLGGLREGWPGPSMSGTEAPVGAARSLLIPEVALPPRVGGPPAGGSLRLHFRRSRSLRGCPAEHPALPLGIIDLSLSPKT